MPSDSMDSGDGPETPLPPRSQSVAAPSFGLGYWAPGTGEARVHFNDRYEITKKEFDHYCAAISTYGALTQRTTYILLQRNMHALETTLAACSNVERMGGSFRLLDKSALGITLTNQVLNWLAAGMLYTANSSNYIERHFGGDSAELRQYRDAVSRASKFAGFRFTRYLRDYAQHAALPLSGLRVSRGDAGLAPATAPLFEWRDGTLRHEGVELAQRATVGCLEIRGKPRRLPDGAVVVASRSRTPGP